MITLYWCPRTRAIRALWLLEELAAPYDLVHIDIRDEAAKSDPAFRAASPMGKVPAIADGDVRLWDSAAIALYLADRFPEAGLAPTSGDPLRARYLQWMVFTPSVLEPAMAEKLGEWPTSRFSHGWGDYPSMMEMLEVGLAAGPWILGPHFSAADVLLGSSLNFMKMFGILSENPVFEDYIARCTARPAFARAMEKEVA